MLTETQSSVMRELDAGTYIIEQLPIATAQIRAINIIIKKQNDDSDLIALRAEVASAQATIAALVLKKPKDATRAPVSPPTAHDIAKWTPGRTYCWHHGYMNHNGSISHKLEKEPKWKRDAKNPGPLHGQYGSRNLE